MRMTLGKVISRVPNWIYFLNLEALGELEQRAQIFLPSIVKSSSESHIGKPQREHCNVDLL
jgi:hypothetical protein